MATLLFTHGKVRVLVAATAPVTLCSNEKLHLFAHHVTVNVMTDVLHREVGL